MRPNRLDVFFGNTLVGHLHDLSPLAFEYAATWLTSLDAFSIATLSLQPGRQDSAAVQAAFENLLPEGELRQHIAERKKASTLFSMLLEVAGDTAGGFVILPAGQQPGPATYETTSWAALAARLDKKSIAAIDIGGRGARISLAGAQDKASIAVFDDGVPRITQRNRPLDPYPQAGH